MITLLVIDSGFIIIAGLVMFLLMYYLAYKTDTKWLYAVAGVLWFIPIFLIDNIFIIVGSIVMILFSATLTFVEKGE